MSFTAFTNIITILFCIAVLVQSVRMMRSLKQVREGQLDRTVAALDTATAKARGVLSELKDTLTTEGAANARALGEAREVREELNVMVGIANAMAERLIEAASTGSQHEAPAPKEAPSARSRGQKAKTTNAKTAKSSGSPAGAAKGPAARKPRARSTPSKPELVLDLKEIA
jgi:hypothetical protein